MGAVNSPRECIICGKIFYPSVSNSLFCCESTECKAEYDGVLDNMPEIECDDLWEGD